MNHIKQISLNKMKNLEYEPRDNPKFIIYEKEEEDITMKTFEDMENYLYNADHSMYKKEGGIRKSCICKHCKEVKDRSLFSVNRQKKRGIQLKCNQCMSKYNVKYNRERKKVDELYLFKCRVRSAVGNALKGVKSKLSRDILGISFEGFKDFLGVSIEGKHLDHVLPMSWGETKEEVHALNHYSNFQVLSKFENISKGNKFCKKENLDRVLKHHNNTEALKDLIKRNNNKIK